MSANILWLHDLRLTDLAQVGGKNSSLGEMIGNLAQLGVSVPGGFATTADAFRAFIAHNDLDAAHLRPPGDARRRGRRRAGRGRRGNPRLGHRRAAAAGTRRGDPRGLRASCAPKPARGDIAVAVRSSATAEDLPDASFAGQQETFLNVTGIDDVVRKVKEVFASLYNDRAIAYRVHHGFKHEDVFLSAGVQLMVRSDVGASGVLFTLDTESGFRDVVFITASYGLGENVVQGAVNPDEFYVYKPTLRAGKPAILRRSLGTKQIRMVYSDQPGERVRNEDTPADLRNRFSIIRRRRAGTGEAGAGDRAALRPPDGHRVGEGRRHRQALHRAGAAGDGEVARPRHADRALRARSSAATSSPRAARSARRSAAAPRASCASSPT